MSAFNTLDRVVYQLVRKERIKGNDTEARQMCQVGSHAPFHPYPQYAYVTLIYTF